MRILLLRVLLRSFVHGFLTPRQSDFAAECAEAEILSSEFEQALLKLHGE